VARLLSPNLNQIMLHASDRQPTWQVLIYDVRSTTDTIGDIVRLNLNETGSLEALTGPVDFTEFVTTMTVNEQRGDYVNGGIAATAVDITIVDPAGTMDTLPLINFTPADAEWALLLGRFFRKGNVVVVRLGDARIDSEEWPTIFTGEIAGQAGRSRGRTPDARSYTQFKALSRDARFTQFPRTSTTFTIGNTLLSVAQTVAEEEMGLDLEEIDLSGWGTALIAHQTVQLVEETPMSMLAKIMFGDGFMPRFTGYGQLTQTSSTITGIPERVYETLDLSISIDRPFSEVEQPNTVRVLGLGAVMEKVVQPNQTLATADVTTGFFANNEEIKVYWSDDHTIMSQNSQAKILKGVNQGISVLGGGEEFEFIPAPGVATGDIGVIITIDTGFAPYLVVYLLVEYVILAAVPDEVIVEGYIASFGFTINVGGIAQAAFLAAALYIMTKIGRGQYEFKGEPIEWVFPEIRAEAYILGTSEFDANALEIENHFISTQAEGDNAARNTLFLLQAEENERTITMIHDLMLEPDDIFEVPSGQRYLIDTISYTLVRDASAAVRATLKCFEVTPGVLA